MPINNDEIPPGLEGAGYAAGNTMAFQSPTPAPQPSLLDRVIGIFHGRPQPAEHPVDTYLNRADQLENKYRGS